MAPISTKSKSSRYIITIFTVDWKKIIANTIHMVGNASFFSSLLVLSSISPSSWLMDSACCKHMTPHLSSFSQFEPAPRPLNIHIVNSSTMFVHNIGSLLTSNLSIPRVFNVPNLSYNFFFFFCMGQLAKLSYCITFDYSRCTVLDPRM